MKVPFYQSLHLSPKSSKTARILPNTTQLGIVTNFNFSELCLYMKGSNKYQPPKFQQHLNAQSKNPLLYSQLCNFISWLFSNVVSKLSRLEVLLWAIIFLTFSLLSKSAFQPKVCANVNSQWKFVVCQFPVLVLYSPFWCEHELLKSRNTFLC